MVALQTKEAFLAAQEELSGLELSIAKGQEDDDTDERINKLCSDLDASPWTFHPDHGCVLKSALLTEEHYHEVADRCHVTLCNLEDHLINHPAVQGSADAMKKLQQASALIAEVYQWAGTWTFGAAEPASDVGSAPHSGLWRNNPATPGGKYLVKRRDGTVVEWPFFVIGARDPAAVAALTAYAYKAASLGMDKAYVTDVQALAEDFQRYLDEHGKGDPEAPPHRVDDPETVAQMRGSKGA